MFMHNTNSNNISEMQAQVMTQFMYRVYGWMAVGLSITAAVSYGLFYELSLLITILNSKWLLYALFMAQIGVVMYISASLERISYKQAATLFVLYSTLVGVTLTPIFLVYTMASIMQTFMVAAGMFICMAIYGYITQDDLTRLRSVLLMGLFGLIILNLSNIYFASTMMDYYLSMFGVVLFAVLTAYDMQKLKMISIQGIYQDAQTRNKMALIGALTLYLDFLNLFINLLKILGKKRN